MSFVANCIVSFVCRVLIWAVHLDKYFCSRKSIRVSRLWFRWATPNCWIHISSSHSNLTTKMNTYCDIVSRYLIKIYYYFVNWFLEFFVSMGQDWCIHFSIYVQYLLLNLIIKCHLGWHFFYEDNIVVVFSMKKEPSVKDVTCVEGH